MKKGLNKVEFYWVWKDSTRESILNQYYWDYQELMKANKTIKKVIDYIKENKLEETGDLESMDVKVIMHFLKEYYGDGEGC